MAKNASQSGLSDKLYACVTCFASTIILVGGLCVLCFFAVKNYHRKTSRPFVVEKLRSAKRGDFIRWENGALTLIDQVRSSRGVCVRDPISQMGMSWREIDDVASEIVFVCRKEVDPVIWEILCVEYISKMMEIPYNESPATQSE